MKAMEKSSPMAAAAARAELLEAATGPAAPVPAMKSMKAKKATAQAPAMKATFLFFVFSCCLFPQQVSDGWIGLYSFCAVFESHGTKRKQKQSIHGDL